MRRLHYHLVDVFTTERFGGNPLAVFTNGRGVSAELMQTIARELNLSETTFVLPPADATNDWRVRIFTPAAEMPMAGHPTIGTSYVLAREHMVDVSQARPTIRLEEQVGVIPVSFTFAGGEPDRITMQQPAPTFGPVYEDRATVAALLSLDEADLEELPVESVSTGVPFLFVPLRTLDAMRRIQFRVDVWERTIKDFAASKVFVFTQETVHAGSTVHARMFAPGLGIREDPATGAASGPLGCYLVQHGLVSGDPSEIISEQGYEMGRPSTLYITIGRENGRISRVLVGGQCVYIGEGALEI